MKPSQHSQSIARSHPLRRVAFWVLAAMVCEAAHADILSVSTVQGQVGFLSNTGNDGNPNFGLPTTFNSPIGSSASQGGDGFAEAFSGARYGPHTAVYAPMYAFAEAVGPGDAFGNQAQSTAYLDDLLAWSTLPQGTAALSFQFELDGSANLTPVYSNDELTYGFTVQSLGAGGALDNSCHKDLIGLNGNFDFLCSETVPVTSEIYFYEFMSASTRGDWCPGGGCTGILDASGAGSGLLSIEALDAGGNPLGPVSLLGASGATYGSTATPVPEPSSLPLLAAIVGLAWASHWRRHH